MPRKITSKLYFPKIRGHPYITSSLLAIFDPHCHQGVIMDGPPPRIEFRVGGLAGNDAKPLAKVSGGELSRISLAIQVLTSRSACVPTLILNEVDVGIGGGVAEIVGRLEPVGSERQVLCVTHAGGGPGGLRIIRGASWAAQCGGISGREGEEGEGHGVCT